MPARRCSMCGRNWPLDEAYKECPVHGTPTDLFQHSTPISDDEARSLAAHAKFEAYYLETRGVPADHEGPPDLDPLRRAVTTAAALTEA